MFSIVDAPIYIPTNSVGGFPFLHTLSSISICRFLLFFCRHFNDGHSHQYEMVPHCSFDLHLSMQPNVEKLYTVSKNKTGSWVWLRSLTPYCKAKTEIEESGETTRLFRNDINQIHYDYTVEVTDKFKGLDLIRVPEELWMEVVTLYRRW